MKNSTFWELPSFSISGKNRIAPPRHIPGKPLSSLFWFLGMGIIFFFNSCGPVPEEIAHQKALQDSAAADSIMRVEAEKIKQYELAKKKFNDSVKSSLKALQDKKLDSLKNSSDSIDLSPKIKENSGIRKKVKSLDSVALRKPKKSPDTNRKRRRLIKDSVQ